MNAFARRYQAPLAALLLVLAVLLVAGGLLLPVYDKHREYDGVLERGQERLQRLTALMRAGPSVNEGLERVQREGIERYYYPPGWSSPQVTSDMQRRVGRLAEAQGLTLNSVQVLPDQDVEGHARTGIRITTVGDLPALRGVLENLATMTPLLFVDGLALRPLPPTRKPGEKEATETRDMQIQFDVHTYRLGSGG
ncbi:MAG: type II secretion system protein GspM [Chromatiales bacterium]|jgi:hypothetical protein|nr:type II secretion system protein GspM [Chromatiales bacterium]MDX9767967.1 type II secretion system protein GspM [Ectothiorhodospiraceae bacterium]